MKSLSACSHSAGLQPRGNRAVWSICTVQMTTREKNRAMAVGRTTTENPRKAIEVQFIFDEM